MTAEAVAERLGGTKVLRKDVRSELDLADLIHEGVPTRSVDLVLESGVMDPNELYSLVIPRRTLAHRKKTRTLSPEQSDRLVRAVRAFARAEEALGSAEKAARWIRKENRALGGRRPIELLESDAGVRIVERVLG